MYWIYQDELEYCDSAGLDSVGPDVYGVMSSARQVFMEDPNVGGESTPSTLFVPMCSGTEGGT